MHVYLLVDFVLFWILLFSFFFFPLETTNGKLSHWYIGQNIIGPVSLWAHDV